MVVSILLILLLCVEFCGGQSEIGIDKSKRSHSSGHHHHRKKAQFNTPDVKLKYGADLPSFSFDYSEYFAGAMIERSFDKNELHLTMFMLGHNSIASTVAFESLSTEEDILYSWGQAAKVWTTSHATIRNTSTTVGSGLFCTIHNNDNRHSPYQVPAYWVPMEYSNAMHGIHAILRCKIKGALAIYKNETFSSNKKLFVDVSRKLCSRHHPEACLHPFTSSSSLRNSTSRLSHASVAASPSSSSSTTVMSSDPTSVIISFSVPWKTRYVGYPLQFQLNSTHFDSWASVAPVNHSGANSGAPSSLHSPPHKGVTHLCVGGLRPLHPLRGDVGLPMLIEFIQHHLALGVQHILLGLQVDWHSPVMYKHLHILRPFISEGRVSVVSLNAVKKSFEGAPTGTSGVDDVAGVEGLQLKDDFATGLFVNQCLYYSKGVADNVVLLKASDFLLPAALIGGGADLSDLIQRATTLALLSAPHRRRRLEAGEASAGSATAAASGGHLRRPRPHRAGHNESSSVARSSRLRHSATGGVASGVNSSHSGQPHLRIGNRHRLGPRFNASLSSAASTGRETAAEPLGLCSLLVPQYGVPDPNSLFGWGPGEDYWTRDYFKVSAGSVQPLQLNVTPGVVILPTRSVVSVEVTSASLLVAHCRQHRQPAAHHNSLHNSSSSSSSISIAAGVAATAAVSRGHPHHSSQVPVSAVHPLHSGVVPVTLFAALLYRETFTSDHLLREGGRQKELVGLYAHNAQTLQNQTASQLGAMGLSTIGDVKRLVSESRSDYSRSVDGAYTAKGRESIKKPFWRSCSTQPLQQVLAQGYFGQ